MESCTMKLASTEIAIKIIICDYDDIVVTRVIKHWYHLLRELLEKNIGIQEKNNGFFY